jgi:hypothetical protein
MITRPIQRGKRSGPRPASRLRPTLAIISPLPRASFRLRIYWPGSTPLPPYCFRVTSFSPSGRRALPPRVKQQVGLGITRFVCARLRRQRHKPLHHTALPTWRALAAETLLGSVLSIRSRLTRHLCPLARHTGWAIADKTDEYERNRCGSRIAHIAASTCGLDRTASASR